MSELFEIGERIVALLKPSASARLNTGIDIGSDFPRELRDLYGWRDGEKYEDMFNPIFDFHYLTFEESMSETAYFRAQYHDSPIIKEATVIGDQAFGNGYILAWPAGSGLMRLGNFIIHDGVIFGVHDSIFCLMQTTLAVWMGKGNFSDVARGFSRTFGAEVRI